MKKPHHNDVSVAESNPQLFVVSIALEPDRWPADLTESEREVCRHLIRGASYADIAAARDCSESTVSNHIGSALKKTDTRSSSELLALLARLTTGGGDGPR